MTKFQKIQKFSSIIPYWSTFFVAVATMVELKRRAASKKIWFFFILTFILSVIAVYLLNAVIMTGKHPLLNVIASGLILAAANILFVDFQVMSVQRQQATSTTISKTGIIICCLSVVLVGIAMLLFALLSPAVDIEDINGTKDTSLAVIDVNEFLTASDHYSAFSSYTSQIGSSTNVTGKLKGYDYQECSFQCQKISGVITLQATKTTCNQISLEICSQLEEGNMELVVIVDGEYYDHVPINQNSSIVLSGISGKTVVVKMAAESAKVSVSVTRVAG